MAVRTVKPLRHSSVVDFEFALSMGASIAGKGQVAWVSTEGHAGIVLQIFRDTSKGQLEAWLMAQDQLASKKQVSG